MQSFCCLLQVLFLGKIKASHKRAPPSFIDEAIIKFQRREAEKDKVSFGPSFGDIFFILSVCFFLKERQEETENNASEDDCRNNGNNCCLTTVRRFHKVSNISLFLND